MATSIYVYQNLKQYQIFYTKPMLENNIFHDELVDLYIKEFKNDKQLWIITNGKIGEKERPNLSKSMVNFRGGTCDKFKDGTEVLVKHGNIFYNYKTNKLIIDPHWLGESLVELHVDRYVGESLHKSSKLLDYFNPNFEIDYDNRFYDLSRDRINLILKFSSPSP